MDGGGHLVGFDFRSPDYVSVFRDRAARLTKIRQARVSLEALGLYYADHIPDFINDWGMTYDPRNIRRGLPARVPFILFPRQREWVDEVIDHWKRGRPLLSEKSRDMGLSWLMIATACSLCLFRRDMAIGFGSRKQEYVDKLGEPRSLFYKARMFMNMLPPEFRQGWSEAKHAPHMRISFPATGSVMTGEAGDNIGRGDRTSIYFVDEAAYLLHPEDVDAALSQTTDCRIDISSVNGPGNSFAAKRHGGNVDVFTFHWRDDPRKSDKWYEELESVHGLDPVIVAQEVDIDYSASLRGALIPSAWVQSAIDAHIRLGFRPSGERILALDVADEGADSNAVASRRGMLIDDVQEWSGKGSDVFATVSRAFLICDEARSTRLRYDADGIGADVRGDARVLNEQRGERHRIQVDAFQGSAKVVQPRGEDIVGRHNEDMFSNLKAQQYWALRTRFRKVHDAVTKGTKYDEDELISISSKLRLRNKLVMELSQPTWATTTSGKIVVDKNPEGTRSPNLSDAVMMACARIEGTLMRIDDELLEAVAAQPQRGRSIYDVQL